MTGTSSPTATVASAHDHDQGKAEEGTAIAEVRDEEKPPRIEHEFTKDFGFLPIPRRLRYDPDKPPHFGLALNIAFGFACTFIVANLYYCQPLLIQFSLSFNVSYDRVSRIPTLIQAGYATGLVLISPLGDLVRRRSLILAIVFLSTCLTIGLAVTSSLIAFETLSFLVGALTVTPQILLPLAADLAPAHRRASAISVVLSGLLLGILIARVLAGTIAQFASWRVVYYLSLGVQALVLAGAYLLLPDFPSKNKDLSYAHILGTMAKFAVTEPQLIQAGLINLASAACFANFWVTLTFLLGGEPYNYSTLVIGLFGLIGMAGVAGGPLVGHLIDRLVPWYASLFAISMLLCFQAIQTAAGGINSKAVGAVVVATFGLDVFRQMLQVSLTTAVFGISVSARARLNAVLILSIFIGQVLGTSIGTSLFIRHGWRASALFSMGLYGLQLLVLLVRGPHVGRHTWVGWEGGWEARKGVVEARRREREEGEKEQQREELEKEKEKEEKENENEEKEMRGVDAQAEGGEKAPAEKETESEKEKESGSTRVSMAKGEHERESSSERAGPRSSIQKGAA